MTIRLGANPIGWSNDDLQEIGGETPLETCLAEAREAGFEGMELGHKFPRDGRRPESDARAVRARLHRRLAFDRIAQALGARGIRCGETAFAMSEGAGNRCGHRRRDLQRDPRRPREAAVASARV